MSQWLPIAELAAKVQAGELKAVDLIEQAFKTIENKKEYNAIIAIIYDRARARACEVDQRVSSGEAVGRLAGVPFIAKDNFLAFGAETTAGSDILRGFVAPYQATAIERLEAEGAICVAKANLDAFAHGSSTENSDFGATKNPHDPARVPGGSSGGSAAAIVLDMAPFALGTDTGGSIRQPASFCGCVGYKPTYGLVSRSGVVAMGSSLDTIGPLARTVEDTALVLDVMSGRDKLDSTTIDKDVAGYVISSANERSLPSGRDDKILKIGVIKECMGEGLDNSVRERTNEALEKLKQAGLNITEVSLPSLPLALAVYYIICPAEISSNLSRYDGQRYGFTASDAKTLEESYKLSRGHGFNDENKRRIMIGTYVLSSGYYDAYYRRAQTVRTKLIKEFEKVFEQVDVLVGPTAPTTAFKIGEHSDDPLAMYLTDIMTVAANLTGVPAISLPCGSVDGLPVGLQLIAAQRHDRQLLELSSSAERVLA